MPITHIEIGNTGLQIRDTINEMIDVLNSLDGPTLAAALIEAQNIANQAQDTANQAVTLANQATAAANAAADAAAAIDLTPYARLDGANFVGPVRTQQGITNNRGYGSGNVVLWAGGVNQVASVADGIVKAWTLTSNRVVTDGLNDGEAIIIRVNPNSFNITWPAGLRWNYGAAPMLTSGVWNTILLWKVGALLNGAKHGEGLG